MRCARRNPSAGSRWASMNWFSHPTSSSCAMRSSGVSASFGALRYRRGAMGVSTIHYLTTIEFGAGALAKLRDGLAGLKISRPLIVSDRGLAALGIVDPVSALSPSGSPLFLDVETNPTERAVDKALAIYRKQDCDGLIALGGGSPI